VYIGLYSLSGTVACFKPTIKLQKSVERMMSENMYQFDVATRSKLAITTPCAKQSHNKIEVATGILSI